MDLNIPNYFQICKKSYGDFFGNIMFINVNIPKINFDIFGKDGYRKMMKARLKTVENLGSTTYNI